MSQVVVTQAIITIPCRTDIVFATATDATRFAQFFKGFGPIPGITSVKWLTHPPGAGGKREVLTADGHAIEEQVVALDKPHTHRYRIPGGFAAPFSWLVRSAEARWSFASHGPATIVTWDYTFELTHPLSALITVPLIKLFFRAAMQRCLKEIANAIHLQGELERLV
ncbi:MAG: SRPBCC family protein [Myxococcota bacterium]|nr:SRPBCC family protein [Myxococcota bacterium]